MMSREEFYAPMHNSSGRKKFIEEITRRDGDGCSLCGATDVTLELDHKIPRMHGGSQFVENVRFLCVDCHKAKSATEAREAMKAAWNNLEKRRRMSQERRDRLNDETYRLRHLKMLREASLRTSERMSIQCNHNRSCAQQLKRLGVSIDASVDLLMCTRHQVVHWRRKNKPGGGGQINRDQWKASGTIRGKGKNFETDVALHMVGRCYNDGMDAGETSRTLEMPIAMVYALRHKHRVGIGVNRIKRRSSNRGNKKNGGGKGYRKKETDTEA